MLSPLSRGLHNSPVKALQLANGCQTLRIWFVDMWSEFNREHNFFMFLLENAGRRSDPPFTIQLDDTNPDVLISGMIGDEFEDYPRTPLVFFTGENKRPGPQSKGFADTRTRIDLRSLLLRGS